MQKSGVVEVLQEKSEVNGKRLRSPLYSIKLDDGVWYNFGFKQPTCAKGDVITFDAKEGKWGWEGDPETVAKATGATAKAAQSKADDRQTSIVYQSQHRDALEAVKFAIDKEIVTLPKKKADQYDVFISLVRDLTVQWTHEALNPSLEEVEDTPPWAEADEDNDDE